jgi:hypothetical protein
LVEAVTWTTLTLAGNGPEFLSWATTLKECSSIATTAKGVLYIIMRKRIAPGSHGGNLQARLLIVACYLTVQP